MTDAAIVPVRLEGVGLELAGQPVFAGLDLALAERRIGLIGRNGAGKSQLLRLIAGLVTPTSGRVTVDGIDPARDRRAAVARIGMLFQNPDHQIVFPTVAEELAFGPVAQGADRAEAAERAAETLARFGRADWGPRLVRRLSQGQRHLLCLMAVLMTSPRLLLLDEPHAGLDLPTVRALGRHLDALPQTVIHASHDLSALAGCDRVIRLEAGRLADDGPPETVLPRYAEEMERAAEALADL